MIDLGTFQPKGSHGPLRIDGGLTMLGRLTTTEEQRTEAIGWMLTEMQSRHAHEAQATIEWTRGKPTILRMEAHLEDTSEGKLYLEDRITETELSGAEINLSPTERQARLKAEVDLLAKAKML